MTKCYSELIKLKTFEERFEYLKTNSVIGVPTFGSNRYLNQMLYSLPEWKKVKNVIIVRDQACDLGISDRPIDRINDYECIHVHHINPVTVEDILKRNPIVFDPENLITCRASTHKQIHYGDGSKLCPSKPIERKPNDTCPWKK